MDKKSKVFFIILGLLIIGSVFATYYRTVITKNYLVEAQTDCDPYTKKCFIWQCDPASAVDGEKCTGDAEKDIWYYNLVERNASRVPLCDPKDENCKALICDDNEPDCQYIFCDEKTKVAQEVECSDPVEYTKENPPKDETTTDGSDQGICAPDNTECQNSASQDSTTQADANSAE